MQVKQDPDADLDPKLRGKWDPDKKNIFGSTTLSRGTCFGILFLPFKAQRIHLWRYTACLAGSRR
jgi:hypothetical protein